MWFLNWLYFCAVSATAIVFAQEKPQTKGFKTIFAWILIAGWSIFWPITWGMEAIRIWKEKHG